MSPGRKTALSMVRTNGALPNFFLDFQSGKVSTDITANYFLMDHVVSTGNENENPCKESK